jgi:hypothetical protein
MLYTSAMYGKNRDALLQHIIAVLSTDKRFVAAWLTGSLGRGEGDDLSDLDLSVAVSDAYADQFCACGPAAITQNTSPDRQALYEQLGQPLVLREDRSWLGEGSCFNHVSYRETALVVDWVFIPLSTARRPTQSRVLFDNVGIPIEQPSVVESLEERRALASRDVGFFWLMMTVALKYLLRRDTVAFYGFISALYWAIQDVKKRVVGEGWQYKRVSYPPAATLRDEIALVRQFCDEMLALMSEVVSLGGSVPEDPISIIEVWLSMAESINEKEISC